MPPTRWMYASGKKQDILFCFKYGLVTPSTPLLPVREVTLISFVPFSYLVDFVKHYTIKVDLAAIVESLHEELQP